MCTLGVKLKPPVPYDTICLVPRDPCNINNGETGYFNQHVPQEYCLDVALFLAEWSTFKLGASSFRTIPLTSRSLPFGSLPQTLPPAELVSNPMSQCCIIHISSQQDFLLTVYALHNAQPQPRGRIIRM